MQALCRLMDSCGEGGGGVAAARTVAQLARSTAVHAAMAEARVLPRLLTLLHRGLAVRGAAGACDPLLGLGRFAHTLRAPSHATAPLSDPSPHPEGRGTSARG